MSWQVHESEQLARRMRGGNLVVRYSAVGDGNIHPQLNFFLDIYFTYKQTILKNLDVLNYGLKGATWSSVDPSCCVVHWNDLLGNVFYHM